MKVTIEIDEKEIVLITVPEKYKNFRIAYYGFAGVYIVETDGKGLNNWKQFISKEGAYEVLGFTKDVIIGEQMKGGNFLLRRVR